MNIKEQIKSIIKESCFVKYDFLDYNTDKLLVIINMIAEAFKHDKKIIIFGNGGSAADSQHMASELVSRLKYERKPLPAISLTTDTSIITSISNDYDFNEIYSRQILALGKQGDICFAISTSGKSKNILKAVEQAKKIGMVTICLTGENGELFSNMCDYSLVVPSKDTQRIQETHITVIHVICELVEQQFVVENKI